MLGFDYCGLYPLVDSNWLRAEVPDRAPHLIMLLEEANCHENFVVPELAREATRKQHPPQLVPALAQLADPSTESGAPERIREQPSAAMKQAPKAPHHL